MRTTAQTAGMADVPVPKEERDRVFRKLLAKADNRTCFDCPQRKPIWASSTFGVFICLDCAGGQRRPLPESIQHSPELGDSSKCASNFEHE